MVSIIIPTRDSHDLVKRCVESIYNLTEYPNYEVIIVDNQSTEKQSIEYFRSLDREGLARVIHYDYPFNYSAINNFAVGHARGKVICLLNNDTEIISPGWLTEMVSHALRPEIGAVGAKLLYGNGQIQHAGVIVGIGGIGGHVYRYRDGTDTGYFSRMCVTQNLSVVTAACLVIRRDVYLEVAGMDEKLEVAFNDVDFCLRVREAGYRNLWTPYAVLYHHESLSRGSDDTVKKYMRFLGELKFIERRWAGKLDYDPYYNPNLTIHLRTSAWDGHHVRKDHGQYRPGGGKNKQ